MKVPRAVYVRFPLGNPLGEPGRPDQQRRILDEMLELLETAEEPQIVELPYRWRRWL
jgi:D-proline reductase (dithiol) PrdB